MYLEFIGGPVLAALRSMKFTAYTTKKEVEARNEQIEQLKVELASKDDELAKKILVTISPMAQAVRDIKTQLGV